MVSACLLLLAGVILGALGSHALDNILTPKKQNSWELAVQYQLIHGLGLIMIAMLYQQRGTPLLRWAGTIMLIGILLFSGSIYATALGAPEGLSQIAPYGGSSLMIAWLLLACTDGFCVRFLGLDIETPHKEFNDKLNQVAALYGNKITIATEFTYTLMALIAAIISFVTL